MSDPKQILQDPDFPKLSQKERRSIVDDLLRKDTDYSALPAGEQRTLKTQLYGKYASSPVTSSPPSRVSKAMPEGITIPSRSQGNSVATPSNYTRKPAKKLRVEKKTQPALEEQAASIIAQNQAANRAARSPHAGQGNPLDLSSALQFATQPISHALSYGLRALNEHLPAPIGMTARDKQGHAVVSPLQKEVNKQQAKLPIGARLDAERPGDFLSAANPDSARYEATPSKTYGEAMDKSISRGGKELLSLDNAAIASLLGPLSGAGKAAKYIKLAVTGYFGGQVADTIRHKWNKFKSSGYKDKDAAADIVTHSALLGGLAAHGVKELKETPLGEKVTAKVKPAAEKAASAVSETVKKQINKKPVVVKTASKTPYTKAPGKQAPAAPIVVEPEPKAAAKPQEAPTSHAEPRKATVKANEPAKPKPASEPTVEARKPIVEAKPKKARASKAVVKPPEATEPVAPQPKPEAKGEEIVPVKKPAASAKKLSYQMTRSEFEKDAIYRGVTDHTADAPNGFFGSQKLAETFSTGKGGRVRLHFQSQIPHDVFGNPQSKGAPDYESIKAEYGRALGRDPQLVFPEGREPFDLEEIPSGTKDPHRYLVEKALKEGKPVPANVLKDYPDLVTKKTLAPAAPAHTLKADKANELGIYFDEGDPLGDKLSAATGKKAVELTAEEKARVQETIRKQRLDAKHYGLESSEPTRLPQGALSQAATERDTPHLGDDLQGTSKATDAPLEVKRSADFKIDGTYDVTIGDRKHVIARDAGGTGWWYEHFPDGKISAKFIGFTLAEAKERLQSRSVEAPKPAPAKRKPTARKGSKPGYISLPSPEEAKRSVGEITRVLNNTFVRNLTGIERETNRLRDRRSPKDYEEANKRGILQAEQEGKKNLLGASHTYAGSASQSNVIKYYAMPLMRDIFGNDEARVAHFFDYLAEGVLQGKRQRWTDLADEVSRTVVQTDPKVWTSPNPAHPSSIVNPKVQEHFFDMLRQMEGRPRDADVLDTAGLPADKITDPAKWDDRTHFSPRLSITAEVLASNKEWVRLRDFLHNTFLEAQESVRHRPAFDPNDPNAESFEEYGKQEETKKALELYKGHIEKPVRTAYEANEGKPSQYLGPLDTYFPLSRIKGEGGGSSTALPPRSPLHDVKNPAARFATGLSTDYDTSVETALKQFEHQIRTNNRGGIVRTVLNQGWGYIIPDGMEVPKMKVGEHEAPYMMINGQKVEAFAMEHQQPFRVVRNGKESRVNSVRVLVPRYLYDELAPLLEEERPSERFHQLKSVMGTVNNLTLAGPSAGIVHNSNLLGAMVSSTPFLLSPFEGAAGKVATGVGNSPGLKIIGAVTSLIGADPHSIDALDELQYLASIGALHPKSGTTTVSPKRAAVTGQKLNYEPVTSMLYGTEGTEIRTRLTMYRALKAAAEGKGTKLTDEDVHDFVNQAGNYSKGLESGFERWWKKLGMAPFVTAGKTQLEQGTRAMTGTTRLPRSMKTAEKIKLRTYQQISGGIPGAVALWAALYWAHTGRPPGKRDKFGQIPLNHKLRASALGQQIFGKGEGQVSINVVGAANPTLYRATKATGMETMFGHAITEGKWFSDAAVTSMQKDMINGLLSPVTSSPFMRAATVAGFGREPYIVSLKGSRGEPSALQFLDAVDPKLENGKHRIVMQLYTALVKMNPYTDFASQVFPKSGIYRRPDRTNDAPGTMAVKMAIDLAFPRLLPFNAPASHSSKDPIKEMERRIDKAGGSSGGANSLDSRMKKMGL